MYEKGNISADGKKSEKKKEKNEHVNHAAAEYATFTCDDAEYNNFRGKVTLCVIFEASFGVADDDNQCM